MSTPEGFFRELLAKADIAIGGNRAWDLRVHDERVYAQLLRNGTVGFGEAFMDGAIDCERIDQMSEKVYRADLTNEIPSHTALIPYLKARLHPAGSRNRSFEIGVRHYDTGNDLFEIMLDPYMTYSCGYWVRANSLEGAQRDKLELICRKLALEPGQRVLDVGCGFGSFARYAAEHYGVSVVGLSVSQQQIELGRRLAQGLPIEFRYLDYRDIDEPFDRIVSVGMFEHVGRRYYRDFMVACERCLKPGGLLLLHTMGFIKAEQANAWFDKYILPGVEFPTMASVIGNAGDNLVLENLHTLEGSHYDRTLMAWWDRFDAGWHQLKRQYGDAFYRMWKLYLQGCAGAFRAERLRVWQFVFSKGGFPGGYTYGHHYPLDDLEQQGTVSYSG
jgi:cyclopropane-fatty-acyl-phospholipid synthase